MTFKTKGTIECSVGLYQPWELQEATLDHQEELTYRAMYEMAVKAIGGAYTTYGVMGVVSSEFSN